MGKPPLLILVLIIALAGYSFASKEEARELKIVAFGDSLVEGVGSKAGGGFVSLLSQMVDRPIVNLGRRGDTTADALKRLDSVLGERPDVTIVLLGGNDYLKGISAAETAKNLALIDMRLKKAGSKVLLLKLDVLKDVIGRPELMSDKVHPNDLGYALVAERVYPELKKLAD